MIDIQHTTMIDGECWTFRVSGDPGYTAEQEAEWKKIKHLPFRNPEWAKWYHTKERVKWGIPKKPKN
jgi:hypothetical protein